MKDMMLVYSRLVEKCFTHCVNDFTSKSLSSKEEGCMRNCAEKFMGHSQRISQRFQEANVELMEKKR
ncbi:hypothetical protein BT69DRAFT_1276910 [Atractiella rhizophila]|nr:hypothetical protein BT69DRAFT_1276910 [Atractiella rhizophila]